MEPAVIARSSLLPLPAGGKAALVPPCRFAAISVPPTFFGGGGGGGRFSAGGGRGGGGGRGDDSSGAGAVAAAAAAVAALGETEVEGDDPDAIVLHVGGMSCGGCAGKVKQILESQVLIMLMKVQQARRVCILPWTTRSSLNR